MALVFLVIGAVGAGGYWYWSKPAGAPAVEQAKGKGKGKGKGAGGPLFVKATQVVAKPMPVLVEAVGTVEPEHSVQVRAQVFTSAQLAVKNHKELAEHIKGCHARGNQPDHPEGKFTVTECLPQDQVLGEKTCR